MSILSLWKKLYTHCSLPIAYCKVIHLEENEKKNALIYTKRSVSLPHPHIRETIVSLLNWKSNWAKDNEFVAVLSNTSCKKIPYNYEFRLRRNLLYKNIVYKESAQFIYPVTTKGWTNVEQLSQKKLLINVYHILYLILCTLCANPVMLFQGLLSNVD